MMLRLEEEMGKQKEIQLKSFYAVYHQGRSNRLKWWILGIMLGLVAVLFLPWTQNIRTRGSVTTLRQEQRPQEINSIIPGRIVKWWVKEGDLVKQGDTLLQLAEIKDDYLDPQLLERTQQQISAKQMSVDYYTGKAGTADVQSGALAQSLGLKISTIDNKLRQTERKVISDSMDLMAARNELNIANEQLRRQQLMLDSGVTTQVNFEQRKVSAQNAKAKVVGMENKLANSRQDLLILRLDLLSAQQEYAEKISKTQGDKFQSLSQVAGGQADIAKLQNQFNNYRIRSGQYYIIAPQDGQVTRAAKAGLNETVKDGENLLEIVPRNPQYAVELFVRPVDLPLVRKGQTVRFAFDGYPAIVFSGWPGASYGVFSGKIAVIENNRSTNGMFRILVAEDSAYRKWPPTLTLGTGAQGFALLSDVMVGYELWRNVNGFPPDYYQEMEGKKEKKK